VARQGGCIAAGFPGAYTGRGGLAIPEPPGDPFDADFVSELEGLVVESGVAVSAAAPATALESLQAALGRFVAPLRAGGPALEESSFVSLPAAVLAERSNDLIESCRRSTSGEAATAVESFIVFFQTLAPTLRDEPAREVKATFFRLAPTLVHMAWDESAGQGDRHRDAVEALQGLETILLEVSNVHLTPAEGELLFKSLDQMATLLAAGEYGLARDIVGAPLLAILRKNRVSRSLFRLMEVDPAAAGAGGSRSAVRLRPDPDLRGPGARRGTGPLPPGATARHPDPDRHRDPVIS
jgi:hypothetical protein